MGWQVWGSKKEKFIEDLHKTPQKLEFTGKKGKEKIKVIFTNLSKKNKEWYKLEFWSDYDDYGKKGEISHYATFLSSYFEDIINEVKSEI